MIRVLTPEESKEFGDAIERAVERAIEPSDDRRTLTVGQLYGAFWLCLVVGYSLGAITSMVLR